MSVLKEAAKKVATTALNLVSPEAAKKAQLEAERREYRRKLQAKRRKRQHYLAERARLTAERQEIARRVDIGELTDRAFIRVDKEIFEIARTINDIDNVDFTWLVSNCPDPELVGQYREFCRFKGELGGRIFKLRTEISDATDAKRSKEQNRESFLKGFPDSKLPASAEIDLERFDTRIAQLTAWIDECENRLRLALAERDADIRALEKLKGEMAEAEA